MLLNTLCHQAEGAPADAKKEDVPKSPSLLSKLLAPFKNEKKAKAPKSPKKEKKEEVKEAPSADEPPKTEDAPAEAPKVEETTTEAPKEP